MTIKAILIDLGGVLVRTEDRTPRTQLAQRFGMTYEELDQFVFGCPAAMQAGLGKITTIHLWKNIAQSLSQPAEGWQELWEGFFGGDHLDYEWIDLLRSLRPQCRIGLLSNNWDFLRQEINDVWQVGDAFDALIISAEIGIAKPDARIYQHALEQLHATPPETVFIDDFMVNIEAARNLGIHAIHFQNPGQARQELLALLAG